MNLRKAKIPDLKRKLGVPEYIRRRDFIKLGLGVGAGFCFAPIINGCAIWGESREEVEEIQWDANPIIPVPQDGCYTGFKIDNSNAPFHLEEGKNKEENSASTWFEQYLGKVPAVYCPDNNTIKDEEFPISICEDLYRTGIIPLIRYGHKPDWGNVALGKYDKAIEQFALGAKKFGKPFFITPWPECNIEARDKDVQQWGGKMGTDFIQAWIHVHDIFKRVKAHTSAVWGLHLSAYADHLSFYEWDLADEFFDWIGFSIYNMVRGTGKDYSFKRLFDDAYEWARRSHRTKPVALFGFGTSNTPSQAKWIKKAYNNIAKDYPAVKLALYGFEERHIGDGPDMDSSHLNSEAKRAIKEIMSDSYFLGNNLSISANWTSHVS